MWLGDTGFGKMVNAKMLTVDHPAVISAFDSVLSSFTEVCEDFPHFLTLSVKLWQQSIFQLEMFENFEERSILCTFVNELTLWTS